MQTSLNGNLVVGKQVFAISRGKDFDDFQNRETPETQFRAVEALKNVCSTFGEQRTPQMDMYRQRLSQLRKNLRMM